MLKFRSLISQLCAAMPYFCLKFTYGTSLGFSIILIAELSKNDSEIDITLDQLSWYASLSILSPFSSLITGIIMHYLGNRLAALIVASIYITSWIMYYYSTNVTLIFASEVVASMTAANTLCPPYISEITEPQFRGSLLAIGQLTVSFGSFFTLLLGIFMYWRHIILVILLFPILTILLVLFTPDSPTWLASKGRLKDAEKALCWLRGWVQTIDVQLEFSTLVDNVQQSKLIEDENKLDWQQRIRQLFQTFGQRSFYNPLMAISIMYTLLHFSGGSVIPSYSSVIFREMNSPIKESIAIVIMGIMRIVGSLVTVLLIGRVGKRKLIFFSIILSFLSFMAIAIVGFLQLKDDYLWIPPIAILISVFAYYSGNGTIVYIINGEIFPMSVRYIGSSIGLIVNYIMLSIVAKLFLYVIESFTLHGTFLSFAIINVIALISYYFFFPETEGRTLKEIEDHYKGVKNLDEG